MQKPNERHLAMAAAYEQGFTKSEIGRRFGISPGRVTEVLQGVAAYPIWTEQADAESKKPIAERRIEYTTLSTRVVTCLVHRAHFTTVGELERLTERDIRLIPNAGPALHAEIVEYIARERAKGREPDE